MNCGCWAGGVLAGGTLDLNKPWWVYAELDQLAGTLALVDPSTRNIWDRHIITGSPISSTNNMERYGVA